MNTAEAVVSAEADEIIAGIAEDERDRAERFRVRVGQIRTYQKSFYEVGKALREIREERLYQDKYGTWEQFLEQELDMERRYADQKIAASEVIRNIAGNIPETGAIAPVSGKSIIMRIGRDLPANEAQCRPLSLIPPEKQPAMWQAVREHSEKTGERITAKMVAEICRYDTADILTPPDQPVPADEKKEEEKKIRYTQMQISQVSPEFRQFNLGFVEVVQKEIDAGFQRTSKEAILFYLETLIGYVKTGKKTELEKLMKEQPAADKKTAAKIGRHLKRVK